MDPNAVNSWGWFALALVNAGLAEQKNRSRLAWFLLSLLLGPFATLYIVAWPAVPEVPQPAQPLDLPTASLAGGIVLSVAGAAAGVAAYGSNSWVGWLAAGILAALALAAFVVFVTKRPRRDGPVSMRDLDKLDQREGLDQR
ncbi:hypothetical protein [Mycetocola manganoxydans]|uniref:hypothetical protein n=1 Tax=Mycetocola manganoxydans TaxID=699879 RepID=UPI001602A2D2|nr:hypothetical protein [Mycetocola manganoxydans]GHD41670.1 hypothetical protein GCM10008097_06670 [Mycetocola manganoxydans]